MTFDIDATLDEMVRATSGALGRTWTDVGPCVQRAIQNERAALEAIARKRVSNEITDEDVREQLTFEKEALEAELLACRVASQVAAQNAVNAALDVLTAAIRKAVSL